MTTEADYYIGLMSGTSADGVDGVLASFDCSHNISIASSASVRFDQQFHDQLISLNHPQHNEIHLMNVYANRLIEYYQETVEQLLAKAKITAHQVKAIAMHGQTIRHKPAHGYSVQIGNAALLAERSGIHVITDFRSRDIAAGGQGAPIAPVLHQYLWHNERARIIVNIGGIANITLLTPGEPVTGFDTGPGNALLDDWIQRHTTYPYDDKGNWAASGQCNHSLLARLLQHPFFNQAPPKSTGRDDFHINWLDQQLQGFDLPPQDVQASLLMLTAQTISDAITQHGHADSQIILCGGGSYNLALIHQLKTLLPGNELITSDHCGIEPIYVEAIAFALLGKLCIERNAARISEVTGAKGNRIAGCIYYA